MATLIVGGITVPVLVSVDQPEKNDPIGGEIVRMFDGTPRTTVRGYKRTWTITTRLMDDAVSAPALKAVLKTTSLPVAVSGDLTGSITCIPRLTDYLPVRAKAALYRRIVFTLMEV